MVPASTPPLSHFCEAQVSLHLASLSGFPGSLRVAVVFEVKGKGSAGRRTHQLRAGVRACDLRSVMRVGEPASGQGGVESEGGKGSRARPDLFGSVCLGAPGLVWASPHRPAYPGGYLLGLNFVLGGL